ncbi:uncharacterized protein LOC100209212 isoform X2 [Hydra vulgaris]|uniref:Uncharacterized protein LOC100209212 isoform X2 n=1 Tax=Hydra vulgaris TaxID=6087 RepID=A0ABM4C291_HYDVU
MRIKRKTDQLTMVVLLVICAWSFTTMYFLWRRTRKKEIFKKSEFREWLIYPQWNNLTNSVYRAEQIKIIAERTRVKIYKSHNVLKHSKKLKMKSPRKNMIDFGREDLEVEGVDDYIFWYENFINNGNQLPILPRQQKCKKPLQDVAFLKTHYTGSDVITNILNRYGDLNNLNVALPTDGLSTFFWPLRFQWKYIDITLLNGSLPNIIANHARYNNDVMDNILNPNSVYITIIRDPVRQLETTFNNLEFGALLEIEEKEDQLKMFLKNPKMYIQGVIQKNRFKDSLNLIKNGQFFDLGLATTDYHKKNVIKSTIQELYEKFTLVLIYEYLDESLVMLKRKLCWQLDDILYLRFQHKNQNAKNRIAVSDELSEMIMSWNKADASLYEFFNRTLWEEIRFEGEDFQKELKQFKETLKQIELDCIGDTITNNQFILEEIPSEKQPSNYYFEVNNREANNGDTFLNFENRKTFSKLQRKLNRKKIRLKSILNIPYFKSRHVELQSRSTNTSNISELDAQNKTEITSKKENFISNKRQKDEVVKKNNLISDKTINSQHTDVNNNYEIEKTEEKTDLNDQKIKTSIYKKHFNHEGSGKEPPTQANIINILNKQATRWNHYFCKKLLMTEIEYLEYLRKKHANSKIHAAK